MLLPESLMPGLMSVVAGDRGASAMSHAIAQLSALVEVIFFCAADRTDLLSLASQGARQADLELALDQADHARELAAA